MLQIDSKLTRMALVGLLLATWPGSILAQQPTDRPTASQKSTSEDALAQLLKLLKEHPELADQLRSLLDKMAKDPGAKPVDKQRADDPPIPEVRLPGDSPTPSPAPQSRAIRTPDISVIGNHLGRFLGTAGDHGRGRFVLGEFEIGLQQPIYPGIRFDAFLAASPDHGSVLSLEEGYATFSRLGHLPFGAVIGKRRLSVGKINRTHPHARLYADQPAALGYLVGPEALSGNGASVNYLIPAKNVFANLELGYFDTEPAEDGVDLGTPGSPAIFPLGLGAEGKTPIARLWLSGGSKDAGELELGGSAAWGRANNGDNVRLLGADLTYRKFPAAFKRFIAQAEYFLHTRDDKSSGSGSHTREGWFAHLGYRPDQYYDWGVRFDHSRLPWPLDGRERSVSLIWTNYMNEQTLWRIQFKHGDRLSDALLPSKRGLSEVWLQFLWGAGSHTHSIL